MSQPSQAKDTPTGFTPGPWHFRPPPTADHGNPWVVLDRDSHVLAIVPRSPREANTRLIAAAPELLASVKDLLADHKEHCRIVGAGDHCIVTEDAETAIAKAEGRQP